jgi:site-specific recombinase XerD
MTSISAQITPLRQKMIDAMIVRGFAARTQQSYLTTVKELARHYHRSPDRIDHHEIQEFFLHLAKERKLSGASCRLYLHGIRFFYLQVLDRDAFEVTIEVPKKAQRIPELLTRREVGAIIAHCANPKHRMMLLTCYGC